MGAWRRCYALCTLQQNRAADRFVSCHSRTVLFIVEVGAFIDNNFAAAAATAATVVVAAVAVVRLVYICVALDSRENQAANCRHDGALYSRRECTYTYINRLKARQQQHQQ